MKTLDNKRILVTGGTGSFGQKFAELTLKNYSPQKVIIYSRDEYKQYQMQKKFKGVKNIGFFIGDVRDRNRLYRAFDGVDIVIHAAALKQVPALEYNPTEAIKTNIHGAENIISAAIDQNVKQVVALSTDKAVHPVNLYGATKMVSDKLFVAANAYASHTCTKFSVVRYGNVSGSRGSVIPFFQTLLAQGAKSFPITDFRMTRFWITLEEGVELVYQALAGGKAGGIYVAKIPSYKVVDLAQALYPGIEMKEVGIREGEKLHEIMVTEEDSHTTYEYDSHFIIYPCFSWWKFDENFVPGGKKLAPNLRYSSDREELHLSVAQLQQKLSLLLGKSDAS